MTKKLDPEKVKVEVMDKKETEVKKEKPSILKRGLSAGTRCCTALQSIFASLGSMLMGKRKPSWLAKITAGFLTVLGWLFFSVAFTPALASGICEAGAYKLTEVKDEVTEVAPKKEEACSKKSSSQ